MKNQYRLLIASVLSFLVFIPAFSQDSLVFQNGIHINGGISTMERGVLTIETPYSDSDFKIEWEQVKEIYTKSSFLINTAQKGTYNGRIESLNSDSVLIYSRLFGVFSVAQNDIVYLDEVDEGFNDRFYASIDLGYTLTKAQNQQQLSIRSTFGYKARKWNLEANLNTLNSIQDEVAPIRRTDGSFLYRYLFYKSWFFFPEISYLTNTEQKLDLRLNTKIGLGNYVVRTNHTYWSLYGGYARNIEEFAGEGNEDRNSDEGFLGTDLNLFDLGDLNMRLSGTFFQSFTESDRQRVDASFDIKYDLPLDLYIKAGTTINYDSQPVEGASDLDYVIQTGIGWEW